MSEGFNPESTATRGRRDPELAARLLEDDLPGADAGETADQSYVGLAAGDMVMGKVTFASTTELGDAWYTFGSQSQVLSGETAEAATERVSAVITQGVLDIAGDFNTALGEQIAQQREDMRHRRIPQQ